MICDYDCFNCKFPDCISDDQRVYSHESDVAFIAECEAMSKEERSKFIDEYNRAKYREKNRIYRRNNKDKINAYQRKHYAENREVLRKQARERRRKWIEQPGNREKIRKYMREYRKKKVRENQNDT